MFPRLPPALDVFVTMLMSDAMVSPYSSSESSSSLLIIMRWPSRESAWHPLHVAPYIEVTSCSGVWSPQLLTQTWPPVPFEVTVDFQ